MAKVPLKIKIVCNCNSFFVATFEDYLRGNVGAVAGSMGRNVSVTVVAIHEMKLLRVEKTLINICNNTK